LARKRPRLGATFNASKVDPKVLRSFPTGEGIDRSES